MRKIKNNISSLTKKQSVYLILLALFCFSSDLSADDKSNEQNRTDQPFIYQDHLDGIFSKLLDLEKNNNRKINIVHIGDSHIQADLLTNQIRQNLQEYFGNGGYGFTFPYSLGKTNGTRLIEYKSDAKWQSRLNIYPISSSIDIGLSGIGLYTNSDNFTLELNVNSKYSFNSLKILYSTLNPQYNVAIDSEEAKDEKISIDTAEDYFIHTIQRGEYLTLLARKYNTTVEDLKSLNNLSGDVILAGEYIRIPNHNGTETKERSSVNFAEGKAYPYYTEYITNTPIDNAKIYSKGDFAKHNIDGFVIENDRPGIIYHSIGVNGAKISDFNKYPLFFKQLNILHPDLVIISFGTNEAHNSLSVNGYVKNIEAMCKKIREDNPNTTILIFTPPPSQFEKKGGKSIFDDSLIGKYSEAIIQKQDLKAGVWDFYNRMGGKEGIEENGKYVHLISKDKIHYTVNGYKVQGEMFTSDFLKAYNEYKNRKSN